MTEAPLVASPLPAAFFDRIRPLFGGRLSQAQVEGMNALAAAWNAWVPGATDMRPQASWLAYGLATAFHETGGAMTPVAEIGRGKGRLYGQPDPVSGQVYYGRGLVQLTWRANYEVQGQRLGLDLVNQPDLALRPDVSANVLLNGMASGQFTGRRLGEYFTATRSDPVNARRIINGTDKAGIIATYHLRFLQALAHV